MGQPVRKIIEEIHPEVLEKPFYTLLIDGTNLLNVSFADTKINSNGIHYGGVFQFFLQLRIMLQKKQFDYIYVFFDGHKSGINRFKFYEAYKANRDKRYAEESYLSEYGAAVEEKLNAWRSKYGSKVRKKTERDDFLAENFGRERDIILKYCNELYIRWIFDDDYETEGDDFISYYVNHKKKEERIYIMSTDEDLTQLIRENVCIYHPVKKKFYFQGNFKEEFGYPVENELIKKIFCGDTSDNIGNIKGVSEERLVELMPEFTKRPVSIKEIKEKASQLIEERIKNKKKPLEWHKNIVEGISNKEYNGDFYEINEKIIDLNHPLLTEESENEISGMMYAVQDPEGRSFENLYHMINEDGIDEIKDSNKFATFFAPFKTFTDKEIKRFEEEMKN